MISITLEEKKKANIFLLHVVLVMYPFNFFPLFYATLSRYVANIYPFLYLWNVYKLNKRTSLKQKKIIFSHWTRFEFQMFSAFSKADVKVKVRKEKKI